MLAAPQNIFGRDNFRRKIDSETFNDRIAPAHHKILPPHFMVPRNRSPVGVVSALAWIHQASLVLPGHVLFLTPCAPQSGPANLASIQPLEGMNCTEGG